MSSFYRLLIRCDKEMGGSLNSILGPSNEEIELGWSLVIEESSANFDQALNIFVNLIFNKQLQLQELGVLPNMITFWYFYEYKHQCNMEFWPDITKRIGELGVVLCISCWEKA